MKAVGQYGVVSMEAIGESFLMICRSCLHTDLSMV